jgi:hypothetical protein
MADLHTTQSASRARRGATAVIAQYIQDLAASVAPAPAAAPTA